MGGKQTEIRKKKDVEKEKEIQEKPYYVKTIKIENPYNKPENIIGGFDHISAETEWYNFPLLKMIY